MNNLSIYSLFEYFIDNSLFNISSSSLLITPIIKPVKDKEEGSTSPCGARKNNNINSKIHFSFSTILNDKTKGGLLLSKVIHHVHNQNKLNLPLFLTSKGIKALAPPQHDLINMINLLPSRPRPSDLVLGLFFF